MASVPTTTFRTSVEKQVGQSIAGIFDQCTDPTEVKLENFPKYVRRVHLKRFLSLYEIFKLILPSKARLWNAVFFVASAS
jgi:hypothetical protein